MYKKNYGWQAQVITKNVLLAKKKTATIHNVNKLQTNPWKINNRILL